MGFPLELRVETPLAGVPANALMDRASRTIQAAGGGVVSRDPEHVRFLVSWGLRPTGWNPSPLWFADSGTLAIQWSAQGPMVQLALSTRRSAWLWLLPAVAAGAIVVVAVWSALLGLGVALLVWIWPFGLGYAAQKLRAETFLRSLLLGAAETTTPEVAV